MFSETAKFHAKINHAKQTSQMEKINTKKYEKHQPQNIFTIKENFNTRFFYKNTITNENLKWTQKY